MVLPQKTEELALRQVPHPCVAKGEGSNGDLYGGGYKGTTDPAIRRYQIPQLGGTDHYPIPQLSPITPHTQFHPIWNTTATTRVLCINLFLGLVNIFCYNNLPAARYIYIYIKIIWWPSMISSVSYFSIVYNPYPTTTIVLMRFCLGSELMGRISTQIISSRKYEIIYHSDVTPT